MIGMDSKQAFFDLSQSNTRGERETFLPNSAKLLLLPHANNQAERRRKEKFRRAFARHAEPARPSRTAD
jgi:hypothetical protein